MGSGAPSARSAGRATRGASRARETSEWRARPSAVRASSSPPQLPDIFFDNALKAAPCWQDLRRPRARDDGDAGRREVGIHGCFHVRAPRLRFTAGIYNGSISGRVVLTGAGGFEITVEGISDQGFTANINQTGEIPVDLVVPLPSAARRSKRTFIRT